MQTLRYLLAVVAFSGLWCFIECYTSTSLTCPTTVYTSCKEAYFKNGCKGNQPSGEYTINGGDGYKRVYCDMQGSLCGGEGGWMRIAAKDMTVSGSECPLYLTERSVEGKRLCGRINPGCSSVKFNTNGIPFNEVCGFVQAYQYGTPDAFRGGSIAIDGNYLDGVSITTGSNPRKHVWSLPAGLSAERTDALGCPCNAGNNAKVPDYVGNAYYCESGNPLASISGTKFYNDILWDDKECTGKETTCCNRPHMPYFIAELPEASTSYVEMRLCHDEGLNNEDIPIESFEFFVR